MLMQRPPCARVPASATTACPAQGWQAPAVIWSWCEVGECSVASQTRSRCGALSPRALGLQINVPGVGGGDTGEPCPLPTALAAGRGPLVLPSRAAR